MTLKLHLCTVVSVSNEGCHSFLYPDTIRKRVESRFLSMAHLICWLLTCDSDCCFWYVTNALCAWIKVDCILSSRRDSRQQPKSAAAARLAPERLGQDVLHRVRVSLPADFILCNRSRLLLVVEVLRFHFLLDLNPYPDSQ